MNIELISDLSKRLTIHRPDLIEKDIIIHQLLYDLSENGKFEKSFVFKGGTFLIKHYLGYKRFSEDIDFTWIEQKVFERKSQKQIRDYLSKIIDSIGRTFEEIANKRLFVFK